MAEPAYPKISEFLNDKYLDWQYKKHKVRSQKEFADALGVKQPTLSKLMSGSTMPNLETILAIAQELGPEFYDVCGVPRLVPADKMVKEIVSEWHLLNKDQRKNLLEMYRDFVDIAKASNT